MKREKIDFFHVPPEQLQAHDTLEEWARWVRVSFRNYGGTHPMFRQYRSHAWQWHEPEIQVKVDELRAAESEKTIGKMPERHRKVLRWAYVFKGSPLKVARELHVSHVELGHLLNDARAMFCNRTKGKYLEREGAGC